MMVSFLAGVCDLCGEARPMATPEQCVAAGLDLDAAVCVECLARANPAARVTVRVGTGPLPADAIPASKPLSGFTDKPH